MTYADIPGWFSFQKLYAEQVTRWLDGHFKEHAKFVELGSWLGRSTAYMADDLGGSRIDFYAVDLWDGKLDDNPLARPTVWREFIFNMKQCGVSEYVKPIRMHTVEAAQFFEDKSVDFCFVDADHSFQSTLDDIRAWLPKMRPGGVMAGHDVNLSSVLEAAQQAFGADKVKIDQEQQIWRVEIPH